MRSLRKTMFMGILVAVAPLCCLAQSQIGLNFGVGSASNTAELNSLGTTFSVDPDNIPSFYISGYARFTLSEKFNFRPELMFTQRGNIQTRPSAEIKTLADVIAVPLWLEYNPVKRLTLKTGIELSSVLSQRVKTTNQPLVTTSTSLDDRFDLGVLLGLTYRVSHHWALELRYGRGLLQQDRPIYILTQELDPNASPGLVPLVNENARSKTFHIGISYTLIHLDKG